MFKLKPLSMSTREIDRLSQIYILTTISPRWSVSAEGLLCINGLPVCNVTGDLGSMSVNNARALITTLTREIRHNLF